VVFDVLEGRVFFLVEGGICFGLSSFVRLWDLGVLPTLIFKEACRRYFDIYKIINFDNCFLSTAAFTFIFLLVSKLFICYFYCFLIGNRFSIAFQAVLVTGGMTASSMLQDALEFPPVSK